jgi:putative PIN family toxin of toxin-antitoxin system
MKKVFIDSSVLLSASRSAHGAAFALISLFRKKKLSGYISQVVRKEIYNNTDKALDQIGKRRLNIHLLSSHLTVINTPSVESIRKWEKVINKKDAHIIASAVTAQVDYIVTLDKNDFSSPLLRKAIEPIKIVQPIELVRMTD